MKQTRRARELYRQTRRAAGWGLWVSLALAAAKAVGGWYGHSLALFADSIHSLGDAVSASLVWGALWWAEQPADPEHPYGHTRIETIAASNVAILLVGSGAWVAVEAVSSWYTPTPQPHWFTVVIALVSAIACEAVFRASRKAAEQTGSKAVEASAWDQRLDVFGSLVVVLGLVTVLVAGPDWHWFDHLAALVVAAIIVWAGGALYWGSLQDLMDRQAEPEMLSDVRAAAAAVPGVLGVEKLLIRKSGLEYFADIHIEVAPQATVEEGHRIGHDVKDRLLDQHVALKDVLVHIEPHFARGER